jgi:Spy/CpxP family protein refolding chaperone
MREIRDNGGSMADMRAVLTPEQQVKAAQLRKEHKEQKGGAGKREAQMHSPHGWKGPAPGEDADE